MVEALILTEHRAGYVARRVTLRPGANETHFELGRDLVLTPLVHAEDPPPHMPPARQPPQLTTDRQVTAILELDWIEGTPLPKLAVKTREGTLHVEDILAEVGLEVTTVWSDAISPTELGHGWSDEERLAEILARHRNATVPSDAWHLHLLLAPQPEPDLELSFVVDPAERTGAVVFLPANASEAQTLHAVLHEIGHLLNLPHPWEVGADTPSVMSYPWRWPFWRWDDPAAYRFDAAARRHLLRAPDPCVRPGAGPFGACWRTVTPVE